MADPRRGLFREIIHPKSKYDWKRMPESLDIYFRGIASLMKDFYLTI